MLVIFRSVFNLPFGTSFQWQIHLPPTSCCSVFLEGFSTIFPCLNFFSFVQPFFRVFLLFFLCLYLNFIIFFLSVFRVSISTVCTYNSFFFVLSFFVCLVYIFFVLFLSFFFRFFVISFSKFSSLDKLSFLKVAVMWEIEEDKLVLTPTPIQR